MWNKCGYNFRVWRRITLDLGFRVITDESQEQNNKKSVLCSLNPLSIHFRQSFDGTIER